MGVFKKEGIIEEKKARFEVQEQIKREIEMD